MVGARALQCTLYRQSKLGICNAASELLSLQVNMLLLVGGKHERSRAAVLVRTTLCCVQDRRMYTSYQHLTLVHDMLSSLL
jgi:hypothetical protein